MSNDQDRQKGGPSRSPKDPENDPGKVSNNHGASAQSQSEPIGDEERANREGAGEGRRSGSDSNKS